MTIAGLMLRTQVTRPGALDPPRARVISGGFSPTTNKLSTLASLHIRSKLVLILPDSTTMSSAELDATLSAFSEALNDMGARQSRDEVSAP